MMRNLAIFIFVALLCSCNNSGKNGLGQESDSADVLMPVEQDTAAVIARITEFYRAYGSAVGKQQNDSVFAIYVTQNCADMAKRRSQANYSVFYDKSDFDRESYKATFQCRYLDGLWYGISYVPAEGMEPVFVSMKVTENNKNAKICYVSAGGEYGDSMLDIPEREVNSKTEKDFVQSFYFAYARLYALLADDLQDKLSAMREQYLTAEAREQYKEALTNWSDYEPTYDLVIGNSDVDVISLLTLMVSDMGDHKFSVAYGTDKRKELVVTVTGNEGEYKISEIIKK